MHKDALKFNELCRQMEFYVEALQESNGCIDCRNHYVRKLDTLKKVIDLIIEENKGVMV